MVSDLFIDYSRIKYKYIDTFIITIEGNTNEAGSVGNV